VEASPVDVVATVVDLEVASMEVRVRRKSMNFMAVRASPVLLENILPPA